MISTIIFALVFMGLFIAFLFYSISILCDYYYDKDSGTKIKFNTFYSIYNVNPCRWELDDASVKYNYEEGYYSCRYKTYTFSFFDTVRYKFFLRSAEKKKKLKKEAEDLEVLITFAQKDIDRAKAQAEQELQKAKKMMEDAR
jgi:hypothetical protein